MDVEIRKKIIQANQRGPPIFDSFLKEEKQFISVKRISFKRITLALEGSFIFGTSRKEVLWSELERL
jgi:hypothetical protein